MRYTVVDYYGDVEIFNSLTEVFGNVEHLHFGEDKKQITKKTLKTALALTGTVELLDLSEVYSTYNANNPDDWFVKVKKHKPSPSK